ncbi:MAG: segregation and condensation protein A [Spirochaetaceae bacterium]
MPEQEQEQEQAKERAPEQEQHGRRFRLSRFEGPLDLLLFLIKRSEIDIHDIPIAEITRQYLEYLEWAASTDLDNMTDFYLMASTLLYIKSRMLLPGEELIEDEDDPRQELVEKLIEYQRYKKLSHLMDEKQEEAEWVIERKKKQPILPFDDDDELWIRIDVWDLLKSFASIMEGFSDERVFDLNEEVTINEKLSLLDELLEQRGEFLFTDLIQRRQSVMELVCAFLALLEAVKVRKIRLFQNRMFGDIRIRSWS